MSSLESRPVLLALALGVRQSGWAICVAGEVRDAGVIGISSRRNVDASLRIGQLVEWLDALVQRWKPDAVAYCQPSGLRWEVPSLDLLDAALGSWLGRHALDARSYTAQEVRVAFTGNPHASRDILGYEVMTQLQLIGQVKTTREWEAIAVAYYHNTRQIIP